MLAKKQWQKYTVSCRLDIKSDEENDNLPYCESTAAVYLADFLNSNHIGPGEMQVLKHHVNNGAMHYYLLLFTNLEPREITHLRMITVIPE